MVDITDEVNSGRKHNSPRSISPAGEVDGGQEKKRKLTSVDITVVDDCQKKKEIYLQSISPVG